MPLAGTGAFVLLSVLRRRRMRDRKRGN
jgi:hypothetical protein